jgi:aminoglycoside phosphotransferase (APT) family kinase protein
MTAERSPEASSDHLRRPPPPEAIEWARRAVGDAARVTSVVPLRGGSSHANHVLRVEVAGSTVEVVLRRWVRADWQVTDPEFSPAQEAATYGLLDSSAVPAPRLLGADVDGHECDVPAILLTRATGVRPGRPTDMPSFLAQLANALPLIHGVDPDRAMRTAPRYRPYYAWADLRVPAWPRRPAVWERAIEVATGPQPDGPAAFIHRDYHPGNTLWTACALTAIVDWTTASWGAPSVDLAHMRTNLAMSFGVDAAEAFLAAYRGVLGGSVVQDPFWDLRVAVDFLPDLPAGDRPSVRVARLDEFVARAVASL